MVSPVRCKQKSSPWFGFDDARLFFRGLYVKTIALHYAHGMIKTIHNWDSLPMQAIIWIGDIQKGEAHKIVNKTMRCKLCGNCPVQLHKLVTGFTGPK